MPNIELYNEDCMVTMARYPDKHFDLAIVDPPFGIGQFWMKNKDGYRYGKQKKWNTSIPGEEYFAQLFRVSKNQVIFGGNYFTEFLPATNGWIIWDKGISEKTNMSQCVAAWTSPKISMRLYKILWSGAAANGIRYGVHPCEMPIKIYERILNDFALPGQTILDTHLGSGSSAIAAEKMKINIVAAEPDESYYQAACKRFKEQASQLKAEF